MHCRLNIKYRMGLWLIMFGQYPLKTKAWPKSSFYSCPMTSTENHLDESKDGFPIILHQSSFESIHNIIPHNQLWEMQEIAKPLIKQETTGHFSSK